MDAPTLAAYDHSAGDYARDWLAQPAPDDMYTLLAKHFVPGGVTVDVGCGAGRDTAWLHGHGFRATGYEASAGLLAQARSAYPGLRFCSTTLPLLDAIEDETCDNVLCETVIMHLNPADVPAAVGNLTRVLKPGGCLYLSWRVTPQADQRDAAGRLYAAFDAGVVRKALPNGEMLLDAQAVSESSGKVVHRIVFRKA